MRLIAECRPILIKHVGFIRNPDSIASVRIVAANPELPRGGGRGKSLENVREAGSVNIHEGQLVQIMETCFFPDNASLMTYFRKLLSFVRRHVLPKLQLFLNTKRYSGFATRVCDVTRLRVCDSFQGTNPPIIT